MVQLYTDALHKATVSIIDWNVCKKAYPTLPQNVVCTGAPGKGTCPNDSGGPVVCHRQSTDQWVLIGVISGGVLVLQEKVHVPMTVVGQSVPP